MKLVEMTVADFVGELAGDSAAPGGGSAAALAGATAAGLTAMVARLTIGRVKYRDAWPVMDRVRDRADELSQRLLKLVDEDAAAYNKFAAALKLPRQTEAQQTARKEALEAAAEEAARVPLETLKCVAETIELVEEAVDKGNPNCLTDAGTAVQMARTAVLGAAYNVRVNLPGLGDESVKKRLAEETDRLLEGALAALGDLAEAVEARLG